MSANRAASPPVRIGRLQLSQVEIVLSASDEPLCELDMRRGGENVKASGKSFAPDTAELLFSDAPHAIFGIIAQLRRGDDLSVHGALSFISALLARPRWSWG
jgi:hypothetical protein